MRFIYALIIILAATMSARAEIISKTINYHDGDVALQGTLVYDNSLNSLRPGIVLFPEWWGHNDYIKRRAQEMAELGYVAFAADMYGPGKVTEDPKQAGEWAGEFYKNRAMMIDRAKMAVAVLRGQINVDRDKIAAIGFCFGGTVALELARSGQNIDGVAAFHAGLQFPNAVEKNAVKAKILVLNGAADPLVPFAERQKFIEEMQASGADLQFVEYGGALHAFTNPDADKFHAAGLEPVGYSASAEKRSMALMRSFFAEIFKNGQD